MINFLHSMAIVTCDIRNQWRAPTICLFPDDKHRILLSVNGRL